MKPDLIKVAAAVERLRAKDRYKQELVEKAAKNFRQPPKLITKIKKTPVDADIRKPLVAHGILCNGFTHHNFLNREN
jgi:hypothetical protein